MPGCADYSGSFPALPEICRFPPVVFPKLPVLALQPFNTRHPFQLPGTGITQGTFGHCRTCRPEFDLLLVFFHRQGSQGRAFEAQHFLCLRGIIFIFGKASYDCLGVFLLALVQSQLQ